MWRKKKPSSPRSQSSPPATVGESLPSIPIPGSRSPKSRSRRRSSSARNRFQRKMNRTQERVPIMLDDLLQLLLEEDLTVVGALCNSLMQAADLLRWAIYQEVMAIEENALLFRSNSMWSKMLSSYVKMVGVQYLQETLRPLVQHVLKNADHMEIDPNKIPPGADIKQNQKVFLKACKVTVDGILKSVDKAPIPVRNVCRMLKQVVGKRFPDEWYNSVGSFLFLRFLCPAFVAPGEFDIIEESPPHRATRAMILVSKVLQNLASGVQFGSKEAYMQTMNRFILDNRVAVVEFYKRLANLPDGTPIPTINIIPIGLLDDVQECLEHLHYYLYELEQEKLQQGVKRIAYMPHVTPATDTLTRLARTLDSLDEPNPIVRKRRSSSLERPGPPSPALF